MSPRAYLVAIIVSFVSSTESADAATLSLRFAGGGSEVTLAPGQTATIEIVFTGDDWGAKTTSRVTGFDARFDVGTPVSGIGGDYVLDGPGDLGIVGLEPGHFPNWSNSSPGPPCAPCAFDSTYFFSAGDPDGVSGPVVAPGAIAILYSITLLKQSFSTVDTYVAFRVADQLPGLYEGAQAWEHRWQYDALDGPRQFRIGTGNPGDADPRFDYHGYELLQPLVIHQVPEPGAFGLLVLGWTMLSHRKREGDSCANRHCCGWP